MPQLSLSLVSYSPGDPGGWSRMFDAANLKESIPRLKEALAKLGAPAGTQWRY